MDDIERRIISAANQAVRQRNYRRARDRALARLSQAYPDTYRQLLEEERKADERESKRWVDISGATGPDRVNSQPRSHRIITATTTQSRGKGRGRKATHQGDLEGEAG